MDFVSLHSHSTYSFLDGYAQPADHVRRAADLGMGALALTEHGNVSSHVRLEQAALAAGVKPIFGLEAYTATGKVARYKWHLGIIARTAAGYGNLMNMVTRSWDRSDEGDFYYEPTVSGENLSQHRKGLAVLSGCSGSLLACRLLGGKGVPEHAPDLRAAMETAERFHSLLGRHYYLEVQAFPELERTVAINTAYERIGRELGIPLIATCDVHYPDPDDNKMQVLLHATGRGGVTSDRQEQTWEYDVRLTYPENDTVLWKRLQRTGLSRAAARAAIENTAALAASCNVTLPKAAPVRFPAAAGDPEIVLWMRIAEGLESRGLSGPECDQRIAREMGLIKDKGYTDFFLITADAIRWAKSQGIAVGPARGSAAASLVCYVLGITEINPLAYPAMMLERFLDPSRTDIPDIDLDFDDERRDEVRVYLAGKYGEHNVGNVMNFVRFRGKSSVKAAAHAAEIPRAVAEGVTELLIERTDGDERQFRTVEDSIATIPAVAAAFELYPGLAPAAKLEGNLHAMSVHAAGLIVSTQPLTTTAALYQMTSGTGARRRVLQLLSADKYDAEYLGFMKMDFLGLTTMGMINRACEMAGISLEDLYAVADDDEAVIEAFCENDVTGIFQFEGRATRAICAAVQPETFMELADINALSRPGPLLSGTTRAYIKAGRGKPKAFIPALDSITRATRGQIIYQEQMIAVALEIGGFDWAAASRLRKIIGKKLGKAQFNSLFGQFAEGARRLHGIREKEARAIWAKLVEAAAYAFNIAHSVSYAKLATWAMWLKTHYPEEFFTASLQKADDKEVTARLLRDAEAHGITVGRPVAGGCGVTWALGGGQIIPGYEQIPGIGEETAKAIMAYEPPARWSMEWLLRVPGIGPKMAEALFAAGEQGLDSVKGLGPAKRKAVQEFAIPPMTGWGDLTQIKGIGQATAEAIQAFVAAEDPFGIWKAKRFAAEVKAAGLPGVPEPTHTSADLAAGEGRCCWAGLVKKIIYRDLAEDERAAGNPELAGIRAPKMTRSVTLVCTDDGEDEVHARIDRFQYRAFARRVANITPGSDGVVVTGRIVKGFGTAIKVSKLWIIEP